MYKSMRINIFKVPDSKMQNHQQDHQGNHMIEHQTERLSVSTGRLSITLPRGMESMATDPRCFVLDTANELVQKAVTEYININNIETDPAQQTQQEKDAKIKQVLEILTETKKDINNLFAKIDATKKLSLY